MKTAYPNTQSAVSITLYRNIPFDNTYKHHTLISTRFRYGASDIYVGATGNGIPAERFLNRRRKTGNHDLIYPRTTKTDVFNFEYGNGLITKVVMELTPAETNSNYMKVVCGDDIYYYFITSIIQQNFDTYSLSLELDVLMTYQDEFLDGIGNKPVFTKRKHSHRYTNDGLVPYCADFKTGDSAFAGVKPNIIKAVYNLNHYSASMNNLKGIYWLYICCDSKNIKSGQDPVSSPLYSCLGKTYPMVMLAFPIGDFTSITYQKIDGTCSITYSKSDIAEGIKALIGDGSLHGCKISPYPPFNKNVIGDFFITRNNKDITIATPYVVDMSGDLSPLGIYRMRGDDTYLYYASVDIVGSSATGLLGLLCNGAFIIGNQGSTEYFLTGAGLENGGVFHNFVNANAPTINSLRYDEPKLLFSPFKKYILSAQYTTDGYELFPELELSMYPLNTNSSVMGFKAHATSFIGDNNFYIEVYKSGFTAYENYKYEKLGLMTSVNYLMPSGTDALDVFNSTQLQSFYTSKVASGISGGLGVAGGVASIAIGSTMVATTGAHAGALTPAGMAMIAGGVASIASGTAGIAETIASSVKKIEDLKNTPQSINVSGSNFQIDDAILGNDTYGLPYIVVYDVPQVIKDNANDYFYQFGYEVARCCYFNTDLSYDASTDEKVDNNLFGRTLFNYVQINEDITNKISADIPLIVKQKISSIFNNGITLWSFFGTYLWGTFDYPLLSDKDVDEYFMRNTYDNTEYNNQ